MSRAHKWDPGQGRWKLRQVIVEILEASRGPVTAEQLVRALWRRGYHPDATRRVLPQFVDVNDEGHVSLKKGG